MQLAHPMHPVHVHAAHQHILRHRLPLALLSRTGDGAHRPGPSRDPERRRCGDGPCYPGRCSCLPAGPAESGRVRPSSAMRRRTISICSRGITLPSVSRRRNRLNLFFHMFRADAVKDVSGYPVDGSPSTTGSRIIPVCTIPEPGRVTCSATRNPKCS